MTTAQRVRELDIEQIEDAIVKRLEPLNNSSVRVYPFPDNPQELKKPAGDRVLVGFRREVFSTPQSNNPLAPIQQQRSLQFEVVLQLKNLRTHAGAYPVMARIRDLLSGSFPDKNKPLYQTAGGFVDVTEGLWTYSMTFTLQTFYVKRPEN
ncbi:MAG: Gp37 family protein [Kovacikia sp.]